VRRLCVALTLALALPVAITRGTSAQGGSVEAPTGPGSPTPATTGPMMPGSTTSERGGVSKPGLGGMPPQDALNLPGPVDPDIYRVGPGDVLLLQLWGKVSRSLSLEVGPEGRILVPGSGTLRVDGRTLRQVRESVLDLMRGQFRDVNMDVRLARPRVFRIYLTGQVRVPGPVAATGSSRIADVLTTGSMLDGASTRRIEILHRDGSREIADLGLFLATGQAPLNPWLQDGDVVFVPVATDFIHAQGAVARPGDYEFGEGDSLITLLRLAGDPIPAAYVDRALLVRWKEAFLTDSLWVNLEDVYARRVNPPLHEGERLYVYYVPQYHLQHEAAIVGEVRRPGTFPIAEGRTRLSDLVTYADGFQPAADLSSIRVHRRNQNAGEVDPELDRLLRLSRSELTNTEYVVMLTKLASLREDYRIDWGRLQKDPAHLDLLLRDGDIVRVERFVSSVRVDGEVRRPGILDYRPGLSVEAYIAQAGGFTNRSWAGKVRVTRAVNGQVLLARNVRTLDPGDFVWVPEKPDATVWQQAQSVLTSLAYVATIVIAIRSVR
jgi:protein involved in polysaccharide export with SLBB domain